MQKSYRKFSYFVIILLLVISLTLLLIVDIKRTEGAATLPAAGSTKAADYSDDYNA